VPAPKPATDAQRQVDPFALYAACGAVFPENDGDEFESLCLRSKPDFAADIRCHLAQRPVAARQGNFRYVAGRFLRRHAFALALGTFMQVLDTTIANVSLPTIAGSLGVSPNQGTWVITSFAVANAISMPLTGWLTRRFGAVRLFTASILLFTLASWLCGLAPTIEALFDEIPPQLRIQGLEGIPTALSEMEIGRLMSERARQDGRPLCFIGAGAYEHHIPSAVWAITTRGEFYSGTGATSTSVPRTGAPPPGAAPSASQPYGSAGGTPLEPGARPCEPCLPPSRQAAAGPAKILSSYFSG
jgi:hypothetical protein